MVLLSYIFISYFSKTPTNNYSQWLAWDNELEEEIFQLKQELKVVEWEFSTDQIITIDSEIKQLTNSIDQISQKF